MIGQVLQEDGKAFRGVTPVVFLHGATAPFTTQTPVSPAGKFKIKGLRPGMYTLVVAVPYAGEMRKTVEVGPSFADARRQIAASVLFSSNPTRSYGVSTVELSIPAQAQSDYHKAQELLSKRDVQGAVKYLRKAVARAPQFWTAWNNLGTIAYHLGHYEEAEQHFREALKYDPNSYEPLVNLGGALLSQGKIDEAFPINSRAVQSRPDDPLAHSQLGQNCFRLGDFDKAEEQLRLTKALDPAHFSFPQLILAQIYEHRREYKLMTLELEDFLKLHPDSPRNDGIREQLEEAHSR